jgi:hypothetical protein
MRLYIYRTISPAVLLQIAYRRFNLSHRFELDFCKLGRKRGALLQAVEKVLRIPQSLIQHIACPVDPRQNMFFPMVNFPRSQYLSAESSQHLQRKLVPCELAPQNGELVRQAIEIKCHRVKLCCIDTPMHSRLQTDLTHCSPAAFRTPGPCLRENVKPYGSEEHRVLSKVLQGTQLALATSDLMLAESNDEAACCAGL